MTPTNCSPGSLAAPQTLASSGHTLSLTHYRYCSLATRSLRLLLAPPQDSKPTRRNLESLATPGGAVRASTELLEPAYHLHHFSTDDHSPTRGPSGAVSLSTHLGHRTHTTTSASVETKTIQVAPKASVPHQALFLCSGLCDYVGSADLRCLPSARRCQCIVLKV